MPKRRYIRLAFSVVIIVAIVYEWTPLLLIQSPTALRNPIMPIVPTPLMSNCCALSAFFTSKDDPQRQFAHKFSYEKILPYYYTLRRVSDAKIFIFVDFDAPELPPNEDIKFIQIEPWKDTMSTNDKRFVIFETFLKQNSECNIVLMTDLFDVHFGQNPFYFFSHHQEHNIYVGIESMTRQKDYNMWVSNPLCRHKTPGYENYINLENITRLEHHEPNFPAFNDGVVLGSRDSILLFLAKMNSCLNFGESTFNCNMPCFSWTMFHYWKNDAVGYGKKFTSPWKKYYAALQTNFTYVIYHK